MKKILISGSTVFTALALVAGPASAEGKRSTDDTKAAAQAKPTPAASGNKLYCIVDKVTGSRISQKVCKTREAWMRDDDFDPLNP